MPQSIVECVPNFSDARRPEVIEAIMQVVQSVPGVRLLDRHSDLDHNRTVLTFAGEPQPVAEAAFRSIAKAAELIDLDKHTGEHPRIGATDVVPFVPVSGVSMDECVALARQVGKRVGEELGIPVYLYEEAATHPERKNLENIRRGQYEGLKLEIENIPERAPDFGPAKLGKAGATVIGARQFLVAFNVYLTTEDLTIAKKIAKAIRHSSGGLRYLKGLGLLVEGRAQVSMNLTNFRETPLARVVELIRREAARYGVGVHHSELVGLIPQDALIDAAVWYMQMDQFEPEQVLERRLETAMEQDGSTQRSISATAQGFLDALAGATPTPGGGSASAYSGAAAAALTAMVARLTIGKKKYAATEEKMKSILTEAEELRKRLLQSVDEDSAAFEAVMEALRLPKDTPQQLEQRERAVEEATLQAARIPLQAAWLGLQALGLAKDVTQLGNLNAISDAGVAGLQAQAAIAGAGYNVRINVHSLENPAAGQPLLKELEGIEKRSAELGAQIRDALVERGGFGAG